MEQELGLMSHTNGKEDRVPGAIERVYSVTINGKNDCVIMTEEEASLITLKFEGVTEFEMYDMTARHGMLPKHLHKLQREQDSMPQGVTWLGEKPPSQTWVKGIGPGQFGGASKMIWEFEDLIGDKYV